MCVLPNLFCTKAATGFSPCADMSVRLSGFSTEQSSGGLGCPCSSAAPRDHTLLHQADLSEAGQGNWLAVAVFGLAYLFHHAVFLASCIAVCSTSVTSTTGAPAGGAWDFVLDIDTF